MNKTNILSFIIDEVAVKCRDVSSNMRKRIHWMLKYMEITVKKYDVRALVLNGWVRIGKYAIWILKVEKMKKGVSNYILETQEQFDKLMTLNNEVRCHKLEFIPTSLIEVESIEDLVIKQNNHNAFSKCSFNTVKSLSLHNLSTDQIKFILTKCKRIDELKIHDLSLQKLDLTQSRIKQFYFWFVSFKESIYLPKEIEKLNLKDCESPNLIKTQTVNRIEFDTNEYDPKDYNELIKTLKGVKIAMTNDTLGECLHSLPSTIRKIDATWHKLDNLEAIINQFPHLIEVIRPFPIQPADNSKVRVIDPILEETQEKYNLRPRKIIVTSNHAIQLNNHPELFEKVEWVWIKASKFNFDVLPSEIKKIEIKTQVNLES